MTIKELVYVLASLFGPFIILAVATAIFFYLVITFVVYMTKAEKVFVGDKEHKLYTRGFISWWVACVFDPINNVFTRTFRIPLELIVLKEKKLRWFFAQNKDYKKSDNALIANGLFICSVDIDVPFETVLEVDGKLTVQNGGEVQDVILVTQGVRNSGAIKGLFQHIPETPTNYLFVNRGRVHEVVYNGPYKATRGSIHMNKLTAWNVDAKKAYFGCDVELHSRSQFVQCIFADNVTVYYEETEPVFVDCINTPTTVQKEYKPRPDFVEGELSDVEQQHHEDDCEAFDLSDTGEVVPADETVIDAAQEEVESFIIEGEVSAAEREAHASHVPVVPLEPIADASMMERFNVVNSQNTFLKAENDRLHVVIDEQEEEIANLNDQIRLRDISIQGGIEQTDILEAALQEYRAKDPEIIARRKEIAKQERAGRKTRHKK